MTKSPNTSGTGPREPFGARLARLRPIAHALRDPHFQVIGRPLDAAWRLTGLTKVSGGFNPTRHACYVADRGVLAQWLADPNGFDCPVQKQQELAHEAMFVAHDYLHCWAYRLFGDLLPSFEVKTPETLEELEEQAFFLILSETVATVGLDYWYMSRAGIKQRCGTAFDMGPLTIAYQEKHLATYRRYDPTLDVQDPSFFERLFTLYGNGTFYGFSKEDLSESEELASWMIRELRISRHLRSLAFNWLAYLGGLTIDADFGARRFGDLTERHAELIGEVGRRLWRKIRFGAHDFVPIREDQGVWTMTHDGPLDCRFANLTHLRGRHLTKPEADPKGWNIFVDVTLSARELPGDPEERQRIGVDVTAIRESRSRAKLDDLAGSLAAIQGRDPGPLEMLFVS